MLCYSIAPIFIGFLPFWLRIVFFCRKEKQVQLLWLDWILSWSSQFINNKPCEIEIGSITRLDLINFMMIQALIYCQISFFYWRYANALCPKTINVLVQFLRLLNWILTNSTRPRDLFSDLLYGHMVGLQLTSKKHVSYLCTCMVAQQKKGKVNH